MLKTKAKLLIALLLVVCVFNMNTVSAVTNEEAQAMLDVIPDEIKLDITEAEYEKTDNIIEQKVKNIWESKGLSTEGMDITIYGAHLWDFDINTATITISGNSNSGSVYKTKKISISYSNSNQRNSADEQYVKNLNIKTPEYLTIDLSKCDDWEEAFRIANEYYNKNINDKNIHIDVVSGAGGAEMIGLVCGEHGADIGIFKNGILYDIKTIGCLPFIPEIIIPDTIKDNDEDYINYAMPIIKKWLKENRIDTDWYTENEIDNITITKGGTVDYWNYNGNKKHTEFSVENGYTVKIIGSQYGEETATIVLKKAKSTSVATSIKKEDATTGIRLEATTNVVSSNVVLTSTKVTEQNILNIVKGALKDISTKYIVYDINLLENNVKIQPNGKVKISIPIPTDYDKTKLAVYRVADNGEKTPYDVKVEGNYATFETDHFSIYVLAEKETTQNTENTVKPSTTTTPEHKKDDTPKTGTTASIYFIIPVAVISALGIIAFRRKETK